ncbi:MAG: TIGR04282 family arsenosugar biosynthesis glycosyltransferase [Candidatus Competibacter sp.]|nr:TIGR04282 family arsenosugar biosynthesis glycosyltransferase [Candidatus Competibacter sp.]MDG4583902.1 TIGR04282 family arsenosugar biosynthesis glycosyltransferase [Candidatus Competibacter sp.]
MNPPYEFPTARLLIFAKAPVPGRVKTRLAGQLGARGAARLYKKLLRRTLTIAHAARLCPVELWCAPDGRHGFFTACRRVYGVRLRRQCGGDLGRRMNHALNRTLAAGRFAVLIGGDCVSLGATELRAACAELAAGRDAVLGPARDGGYLLVGLRRSRPALFRGIAWGTPAVLAATRRRLRRWGADWAELPRGWDVDTSADLRRLRRAQFEESVAAASPKYSAV